MQPKKWCEKHCRQNPLACDSMHSRQDCPVFAVKNLIWPVYVSVCLHLQREIDRNRELLLKIRRLEEREEKANQALNEQMENNKALKHNFEELHKKANEKDSKLAEADQVCFLFVLVFVERWKNALVKWFELLKCFFLIETWD